MAYCRLDSAGTRLGSVDPKPAFDLVAWEEEPGWDQVMIIDGYELVQSHREADTAVVTVMYHQVGWLAGGELRPAPGKKAGETEHAEIVSFKLVKRDSCWKIASPVIIPHESLDHAIFRIGRWLQKPPVFANERMNDAARAFCEAEMKKDVERRRASHETLVKYRDSKTK